MNAIQTRRDSPPSIKTPQELVHIKHKITLRQYKYWILIIKSYREAYEGGTRDGVGNFTYMPMARLTEHLGYEPNKAELRADLEALRKEAIIYNVLGKDGKAAQRGAGFISEWEVSANWIGFKLPDFLMQCIERLDLKNAIFQQLNWNIFNSFSGKYEAILYKLCKDYVGVQRTPYMTIEVFREYMGLRENEYAEFKDLNKFVISGPIRKINESDLSDIEIVLETDKKGRRVVGLQFIVHQKRQMNLGLGDDPAFAAARVTISLTQQRKYLDEKDSAEVALAIERANLYADEQERKGNTVNLGAIYQTAITQGWGVERKAQLEADALVQQKREQVARTIKQKQVAEDVAEQGRSDRRKQAKQKFDLLGEERKAVLVDMFGQQLKGFHLITYRKSGVVSPLLAPVFASWLADQFEVSGSS